MEDIDEADFIPPADQKSLLNKSYLLNDKSCEDIMVEDLNIDDVLELEFMKK